jgi:hypothetical protein
MAHTLRIRHLPGEARVGRLIAPVVIRGFVQPDREIRCDALVDTGAYCLTLPATWKERLGPLPVSRPVKLETADRRFEPLLGYVTLEQAGIVVDMVGHRLIRVPHFDLKTAHAA